MRTSRSHSALLRMALVCAGITIGALGAWATLHQGAPRPAAPAVATGGARVDGAGLRPAESSREVQGTLPGFLFNQSAVPEAALANPPNQAGPAEAPHSATMNGVRPIRGGTPAPADAVELQLLIRAHDAYEQRNFAGALKLVAEHARRFPAGHLAEQREALRVRSLLRAGRAEEARHAAAAFAAQFPHSVLLQGLAGTAESPRPR